MGVSVHREEHLAACAGWALGALSEADRAELERHLAEGCAECEAELARLSGPVVTLAASAPAAAPPPALKARVFASLRAEGVARPMAAGRTPAEPRRVVELPPRRRSPVLTWAFAAAAAALAVTSVVMWQSGDRLRGELAAARQQLDAKRQQLADKDRELEDAQKWSALLEGSATKVVDLQLTPAGSAVLKARAIYDPAARRAVIVFTNFSAPSGSDYELWALRDGKPASLGLIRADASGRAIVRLPDTGDPTSLGAFAVSLEKAGGSTSQTAPQGPVVMVGKIAG
jgi:anti-sigma-K factor RskA